MKRLDVDLSELHAAVHRMGAEPVSFALDVISDPVGKIAIALEKGIELPDLKDVGSNNGLLDFKGHQVLLYIQDHRGRVPAVLDDGVNGNRFHVADCKTLHDMRGKGRFERYVVTTRLDGLFYISGEDWQTGAEQEGYARLWVCQNCLKFLNYRNAQRGGARRIAETFTIGEFFSTYSSFFADVPTRMAGAGSEEGYSQDWHQIAARYKAGREFRCEKCGVDLRAHKRVLHVHHKNGVKSDNRRSNLMALCAACHRQQVHHEHMRVPHGTMQLINRLRKDQGLIQDTEWDDALKYCDPGLEGLLQSCRTEGAPAPEVGLDIQASTGEVVANLDIAWPEARIGVAISPEDSEVARGNGWSTWTMIDALQQSKKLAAAVRAGR